MRIACPNCNTVYDVDLSRIPESGANLKCVRCQTLFAANRPEPAAEPANSADPLPDLFESSSAPSSITPPAAFPSPPVNALDLPFPSSLDEASSPDSTDVGLDFFDLDQPAAPPAPHEEAVEPLDFDVPPLPQEPEAANEPADTSQGSGFDGALARYQIRRPSGKIFGPFDETTIIGMLSDGQLLGTEEISADGETWEPIGSVSSFQAVMPRTMENSEGLPEFSSALPEAGASKKKRTPASSEQSMERIKALYGNRMAAVAVVDRSASESILRKRLPWMLLGMVLLAALGGGVFLGSTPYGYFGLHRLFPNNLKRGSASWAKFKEASQGFQEDTYAGYQRALAGAQNLLAENSSVVESKALYAQAVFYLQRRYQTANDQLPQAKRYLDELAVSAKDNVEVTKARVGYQLRNAEPVTLRPALEAAMARDRDDWELSFLLAEILTQDRNTILAAATLNKVLTAQPKNARALHQLGLIKMLEKKPDYAAAQQYFGKALAADAHHWSSGIESAAIEVQYLRLIDQAEANLHGVLGNDAKPFLAPAELARAHYLMAMVHAARHESESAIKEFEEALKIQPDSATAKAFYGRYLISRRDYAKAIELFDAALKSDAKNIDYVDGLALAMIGAYKLGPAATMLIEASTNHPSNPRIAFLQGRVADEAERGDEAEKNYKRAMAGEPKDWEPSYYLGRFYLRRKRFDDARNSFAAALAKAPLVAQTHTGQGNYWLATGKIGEAKAEYQEALRLDPDFPLAHFGLAQVLVLENDLRMARQQFEAAIKLDPSMPQVYTHYGTLLWTLKDLPGAVQALEKAKSSEAKDANAAWKLGAVYFELNKLDEALSNVETALLLDQSNADCRYYKARIHYARHESMQALEAIRAALERDSNRALFHYWSGNILNQGQRFGDAVEAWQRAVRLKPDYADALEALGHGYQEQQDQATAVGYFEKALAADKTRTGLLMNIGDCFLAMSKYDKAIAKYTEAVKVIDSPANAYFKIGRCYGEKGMIDRSIDWYQKSVRSAPELKEVWRYLGYAYKEKGRRRDAISAFEKYLDQNKEAGDASDVRTEIDDLKSEK